jgi:hypothetical protein
VSACERCCVSKHAPRTRPEAPQSRCPSRAGLAAALERSEERPLVERWRTPRELAAGVRPSGRLHAADAIDMLSRGLAGKLGASTLERAPTIQVAAGPRRDSVRLRAPRWSPRCPRTCECCWWAATRRPRTCPRRSAPTRRSRGSPLSGWRAGATRGGRTEARGGGRRRGRWCCSARASAAPGAKRGSRRTRARTSSR